METNPSNWRGTQAESRARYLAKYTAEEVARWDAAVSRMGEEAEAAYVADLRSMLDLRPGMAVLDVGAGTGTLSRILTHLVGPSVTALEPAPEMAAMLRSKADLGGVAVVEGFCDGPGDRDLFPPATFDLIASRQVTNGLFDPLTAFRHWHHWLKPGGAVLVIEASVVRDDWMGVWQEEVDVLPLSANQSLALTPYLLERAGFAIEEVGWMGAVNALPTARARRYLVVARKQA